MYPVNNYLFIKEIIEDDSPQEVGLVLHNPNAAAKFVRKYEVVDISSNLLSDAIEVGDTVSVRVKDVEDFDGAVKFCDYKSLIALGKKK